MGCVLSSLGLASEPKCTPKARSIKKSPPSFARSLTRQMTMGEAADHKLKHCQSICDQLEEAREMLRGSTGRWIWGEFTDETRLLGRGAYARVLLGRNKYSGKLVAIKIMSKDNKLYEQQLRAMTNEIACMRALDGHRCMVKLYDVFMEDEGVHIVLEYMPARMLFDAIVEKGHFTEADAAVVMKQLLQFLVFMHDRNIVHRDIKPENLLLLKPHRSTVIREGGDPEDDGASSDDDAEARANKLRWLTPDEEALIDEDMWSDVPDGLRLKVIDYGTANYCEAGQHLHSKIGTARYVAPEVLGRDYDKSSDIWSAGIVLYILLCGHAPFKGSTETGSLADLKTSAYNVDNVDWEHISDSAKDLLKHMLVVDPSQRWTAEELLEHMWFQEAPSLRALYQSVDQRNGYLERLRGFAGMNRMKRLLLKLMANEESTLTMVGVARLRDLFAELDTDKDGLIDGHALHRGLAAVGCELSEHDVREFLAVSSADTSHATGLIDINEFIAALFNSERVVALQPEMVESEFRRLDVDGDGVISAADLVAATGGGAEGGGVASLLGAGAAALSLEEAIGILEELAVAQPSREGVKEGQVVDATVMVEELAAAGAKAAPVMGLSFKEFRALLQSPKSSSLRPTESSMRRIPSAQSLRLSSSLAEATPTSNTTRHAAAFSRTLSPPTNTNTSYNNNSGVSSTLSTASMSDPSKVVYGVSKAAPGPSKAGADLQTAPLANPLFEA